MKIIPLTMRRVQLDTAGEKAFFVAQSWTLLYRRVALGKAQLLNIR